MNKNMIEMMIANFLYQQTSIEVDKCKRLSQKLMIHLSENNLKVVEKK